jgi:hypothetical protein
MVTGKIAAYQSVFEWTKQVTEEARSRLYGECFNAKLQMAYAFSDVGSSVWTCIIM